jgi:hypothetical protein
MPGCACAPGELFRDRPHGSWNAARLYSVSGIVDKVALEDSMAQEYKPGEIVPQSGIYTISHDPAHADMPHEVTVIKGRRFPTCRHCEGVTFELVHAARHVGEIDHLEEAHAPAS